MFSSKETCVLTHWRRLNMLQITKCQRISLLGKDPINVSSLKTYGFHEFCFNFPYTSVMFVEKPKTLPTCGWFTIVKHWEHRELASLCSLHKFYDCGEATNNQHLPSKNIENLQVCAVFTKVMIVEKSQITNMRRSHDHSTFTFKKQTCKLGRPPQMLWLRRSPMNSTCGWFTIIQHSTFEKHQLVVESLIMIVKSLVVKRGLPQSRNLWIISTFSTHFKYQLI